VLTFEPHPIRVLAPEKAPRRILASIQHKKDLLSALGVEVLVVIPFTPEFACQEAKTFLEAMWRSCPNLKTLTMGEDWKFGARRSGDVALLRAFGKIHGVEVKTAGSVRLDGERVSSTRIRQAIRDGNMVAVAAMLGREYTVWGTVVKGRKLGRTIGFPTANLRVYNEQLPPDGVWAVEVVLDHGKVYRGAGNLGMRPTVEGERGRRQLEIFLLDYSGDLYGREMEVKFLAFVRGEQKFDSLDALKEQIQKDVAFCRSFRKK
jgi:riboflavin kinase/FMN adenylyltransferase